MATRSEAKLALWSASKKDAAARKFLKDFMDQYKDADSRSGSPIPQDALDKAVAGIKSRAVK